METQGGPDLPGAPLLSLATPHARPKGFAPWNPQFGNKGARLLADCQRVLTRYRDHLPIGPRGIGYQLLPTWVKSEYRDKDSLNKAIGEVLGKARRAKLIPFDAIDDGRTATALPWTLQALPSVVNEMQADRQAGQPYRVEVWVEAKGNLNRIAALCEKYGIPVRSGSGSVPMTATRQAAIRVINRFVEQRQPTLFLVISDLDPNGVKNIQMALNGDVRAFIEGFGGDPDWLTVRHVALTVEQAEAQDPSAREPLSDKNRRETLDWPLDYKMEVEALPPDQLDAIVEDALAAVRDDAAYGTAVAVEPKARIRALRDLLKAKS
jgi:hypothetical protein